MSAQAIVRLLITNRGTSAPGASFVTASWRAGMADELSYPRVTMRRMSLTSPDDAPTDALRAAGWQPVEPLPCGCTPDRLCAPHGWLRDAEQWERYIDTRNQASLTLDL